MMFRELKSRKAKFGFEYGRIRLADVVPLADFVKALDREFHPDTYIAEESGYNEPILKYYTDDEKVAEWIRSYNSTT